MSPQTSTSKRLQGAFVGDDEIKRIVDFLRRQSDEPDYMDEITEKPKTTNSFSFNNDNNDGDELYDEAKQVVLQAGKASASLLQRRLRIGYARAARIIDLLEDSGIVGPADGARPRDILVDAATELSNNIEDNQAEQASSESYEDEDDENKEPEEMEGEDDENNDDFEDSDEDDEKEDNDPEDDEENNNDLEDNDEDDEELEEEDEKKKSNSDEIY